MNCKTELKYLPKIYLHGHKDENMKHIKDKYRSCNIHLTFSTSQLQRKQGKEITKYL